MLMKATGIAILAVCSSVFSATAQVVNPADKHADAPAQPQDEPAHVGSWELPALTVTGVNPSPLREEDRIGTYDQPRWTAHRRFPGTRIYVVPEGKFEFEFWNRQDIPKDGPTTVQNMYEIEMGLPHRFQADFYLVTRNVGDSSTSQTYLDQKFELRYAFADWGRIPGNPTIYQEYALRDQKSDKVETKLLLGDELSSRWHWGANLVYERELSGERENEYAATAGLSYTLRDSRLSVGAEGEVDYTDVKSDRGNFDQQVFLGPSVQVRPLPNMHVDLAPLIGISGDAAAKLLFNLGWEF